MRKKRVGCSYRPSKKGLNVLHMAEIISKTNGTVNEGHNLNKLLDDAVIYYLTKGKYGKNPAAEVKKNYLKHLLRVKQEARDKLQDDMAYLAGKIDEVKEDAL